MQAPRIYAAICHDFVYGGRIAGATRRRADALYREMLYRFWRCEKITDGTGRIAKGLHAKIHNFVVSVLNRIALVCAWTEWSAIRIFGGSHWTATNNNKTEKSK